MKSARLHNYGSADEFRYESVENPVPGAGQALVKVAGAGVNPVDFKLRKGIFHDWMPLNFPSVIGGDFAGTVAAVGAGVTDVRVGDRVMGMVRSDNGGAYAEQMAVDASVLVPVPDGLDLEDAAALPTGVLTGCQLAELGLKVQAGDRVLVAGAAGSVGRATVIAAMQLGATVVAGVRSAPETPVDGASVTVDLADAASIAAAGPFDGIADTVGGETAESLFAYLRPTGRFATVVFPQPAAPEGSGHTVELVVVTDDAKRLSRFANDLAAGKLRLPPTVRLPLEQAGEAHKMLEAGGASGKIVLVP